MQSRVIIASDHGAVALKNQFVQYLKVKGFEVVDLGVQEGEKADYPDMAQRACEAYLKEGNYDFGILCCGTGIGISIAANKIDGIRCALVHSTFTARMAKEHNNANFLSFGGRVETQESPQEILQAYLDSRFEGGRHSPRVEKITALEGSHEPLKK